MQSYDAKPSLAIKTKIPLRQLHMRSSVQVCSAHMVRLLEGGGGRLHGGYDCSQAYIPFPTAFLTGLSCLLGSEHLEIQVMKQGEVLM